MNPRFGKVAVLMGGPSAEREVSLKSGQAVLAGLLEAGVDTFAVDADAAVLRELETRGADRAFIALHGPWGEDGVIQGALETIGMPYTGSGVLGSALAMDKLRSKQVWMSTGIPTPAFTVLHGEQDLDAANGELGLPMFVKPSREGSSLGVTKVTGGENLHSAWSAARALDACVLAEQCIQGKELTIAILGGNALPAIRLETPHTFYDYAAKYEADTTRYLCPCGLEVSLEQQLQTLALAAFEALGCSGWGRVDLMLDEAERPYFLEVNTVPGMTDHSLVPMAAQAAGITFPQLVTHILETSL
jgi:D-alanine-D-alanine ligase